MPDEETSNENPPSGSFLKKLKRRIAPTPEIAAILWRRLRFNVIVGLIVFFVGIYLGNTGTGEELADKGFDILALLEKEWFSDKSLQVSDVPVYFIEITDGDHKRWKDEETTSRDKLARLVEAAYEKEADVIVLDVLLEKPAGGDELLRKAFGNFTGQRRPLASSKVILPVRINPEGNLQRNIFDDLISRYPDIFWRGLAYIEASGSKALFRYWTSYRIGKAENGKEEDVWGIPALAAAMTAEKDGSLRMDQKDYVFSQRIRYRLIPETRSTLRITMPAAEFESGQNPLPSLKGKIVVIGNTSPEMADVHRTPVGALPGMYILGNAINTVLYGLRAPILPRSLSFLFQIFAILVAAVAFTLYPSSRAHLITVSIYFVTLIPLGWLMYLSQGDLYNYMLPVMGMRLRMKFNKYEESYEKLRILIYNIRGCRRKGK